MLGTDVIGRELHDNKVSASTVGGISSSSEMLVRLIEVYKVLCLYLQLLVSRYIGKHSNVVRLIV